jgi:alkylation response protein AidB-like acyl-CoA dehydrogenase
VTVTAFTGDGEISTIIVPNGTPGFTVGRKYSKVGWSASDTRELSFDDVRVPAENLVGERGRGYAQILRILDEGRIAIAALSVGLAQGCVDECLRYVGEREAFGREIGRYQAIQFKVADMETRAHTARLAYYAAAAKLLAGEPFKKEAAIAKLVASNAAMDNARDATQIFGGYGFMNEYAVGRFYRDAKILEVGEGTSEVQRMLIARALARPGPCRGAVGAGRRAGAGRQGVSRTRPQRIFERSISVVPSSFVKKYCGSRSLGARPIKWLYRRTPVSSSLPVSTS